MRADFIEFDVRKTKDNVLIIYHDSHILDQAIGQLSYRELKKIDPDIPTIDEVLRLTKGKIKLDVELKEFGYEMRVLELLLNFIPMEDLIITSFWDQSLGLIKSVHPNIKTGLLLGIPKPKRLIATRWSELFPLQRIARIKADFLVPNWQLLQLGFLQRSKKSAIPVIVWTVNEPNKINKLLRFDGIEGIITDVPDIALKLMTDGQFDSPFDKVTK